MRDDAPIAAPADPLPIAALQHWAYCPRQAALIHLDGVWSDNPFTRRGSLCCTSAPTPRAPTSAAACGSSARCRSIPAVSASAAAPTRWSSISTALSSPIEYKSGRRKARFADELQLCAQAMCLEEMLGRAVPEGAIFHAPERRRRRVLFTAALREAVERATAELRTALARPSLPAPVNDTRCPNCSLRRLCLLEIAGHPADRFAPAQEAACASF